MKIKTAITAAMITLAMFFSVFSLCGCSRNNYSGKTVALKVTAVNSTKITATVGTLSNGAGQNGQAGEAGLNGQSGQQGQGGTPPAKPDGQNQNNSQTSKSTDTSSAMPSDNSSNSGSSNSEQASNFQNNSQQNGGAQGSQNGAPQMGGMQGTGTFTQSTSGGSLTFDVKNSTIINNSAYGSSSDIKVGSVLNVKFDNFGNASCVIIVSSGSSSGSVSNGTSKTTISKDSEVSNKEYTSSGNDENALRVEKAKVTLSGITVNKTGGTSSSTENGDFYGANAGLLVLDSATATIKNATVNTNAVNGNGVFSYGSSTTVNIYNTKIRTKQRNSGGIQTTGGGTTNAYNLDVETEGDSAAAIRSDRGGGTVKVSGGKYVTNGTGSPSIYSTANISAENAVLTANNSEAVVVEGKNSVSLKNCTVTGSMKNGNTNKNIHNVMIYQSTSGDAEEGEASFTMENGSLTSKAGDMFYVTNTSCKINLTNVAMTLANENFLTVAGNTSSAGWGKSGANGGKCELTATNQKINGNITVDKISSLNLSLKDGSNFKGTVNKSGNAGTVNVTLSNNSKWELTGTSFVTSFSGNTANIISNGYKLYVNGKAIN